MRTLFVILAAAAALTTAACNTMRGVGEDVSATGDAVSDAATDATPHN
ncbi:MAG: entericidin A/B family lipoprotein [Caulobacteraceae bacterium]|nr:entericidin A/B family lipoprotein [Caulobacteraceae bacterium]